MVRIFVFLLSLLVVLPSAAYTKVTASVDKNPVAYKDSVVLTIVADDDVQTNALDTSPLLKDFAVGRTSVSTQTSSVNFKTTRTTKWTTLIVPKRTGNLTHSRSNSRWTANAANITRCFRCRRPSSCSATRNFYHL